MRTDLRHYAAKAKPILARTLDMLFPARCAACHEPVGTHGALCAICWQNMHFITDPLCYKCGLPFEFALGEGALCGRCIATSPNYTEARAIFRYDEHSKRQVLALKYYDKTQLAPIFGQWLARAGKAYIEKSDLILPVPLHYWRLLNRRYNQAALLAYALSKTTGLPVLPNALNRLHATPTQSGLTRRQREDNMRGAFGVHARYRPQIQGKSVLLVDDVMTTGATLDACARALHDAGAKDVYVLTLARTVIAD